MACSPLAITPVAVGGSVEEVHIEAETRGVAELDWTEDGVEIVGWYGLQPGAAATLAVVRNLLMRRPIILPSDLPQEGRGSRHLLLLHRLATGVHHLLVVDMVEPHMPPHYVG